MESTTDTVLLSIEYYALEKAGSEIEKNGKV